MDTSELPDINGTLNVATEVGYAPFEYMKDGELVGFEVELIRDFCREYGYCPEFFNTAFDSIIMGVYTGQFDIGASALTITEERKKSVNFGDPFVQSHRALLVRKDAGWTGLEDIADEGDDDGGFASVIGGFKRTLVQPVWTPDCFGKRMRTADPHLEAHSAGSLRCCYEVSSHGWDERQNIRLS